MRSFAFDVASAADLLDILSSPVRLEIIKILTEGEIAVGSLALRLGMSQSAISQHLKKMRDSCIVATRREAQMIFYSLPSDSPTRRILGAL